MSYRARAPIPTASADDRATRQPGTKAIWTMVVFAFALASGVTVSVIYIPQPILAYVSDTFGVDHATSAWTASAAQFGYAVGVLILVPIGEIRPPRTLIQTQIAFTAATLLLCAVAPHLWLLCLLLLIAGGGASVVQLLNPLASRLAPTGAARENATAVIVAGLALGIFGGRAGATLTAELIGWRWVYVIAAILVTAMILLVGSVVDRELPAAREASYTAMVRSMPRLFATSRSLRYSSAYQFLAFGAFNAGWTVSALHLMDTLGFSATEAGAFALIGLSSALIVPFTGRLIRLSSYDTVRCLGLTVGALSAAGLLVNARSVVVVGFCLAGLALMNFTVQVPNQVSFFEETGSASPRANAVFIFFTFTGAAIGAQLGALFYQWWTVSGTAWFSLALASTGLALLAFSRVTRPRDDAFTT
ncbi:MAG: hypothetical protein DI630_12055 [Gordonia sp. (in: high G+C Gram-positive bacteria)]|nr:MAG: hypothetical protein DI630_12055 [Gordonia sp. (in: high G+C Gram-positive bacteria)]